MPTIRFFYGITINMYWDEHPPPHFHARCGGKNAVFVIGTLQKTEGGLDPDKERLVLQWAKQHEAELRKCGNYADRTKHRGE